jgi:hypothetical protein
MIFYWLKLALVWVGKLFRYPSAREIARLRDDRPCPVCGWKKATLRTIQRFADKMKKDTVVLCQLTCDRCAARYWEKPIVPVTPRYVGAGVPRNELERADELENGTLMIERPQ